jgi:4'-phosphopantetheinyl transferase
MLSRDSVYVWQVQLDGLTTLSVDQLATWYAMLSIEERKRADGFRGEGLRRDYIASHVALRSILSECLGQPPASFRFAPGSFGEKDVVAIKPRLRAGSRQTPEMSSDQPELRFNMSHTKGVALISVALGREVGVDIEWQRPMDDLDEMARAVMSNDEWTQWAALKADEQTPAFYHLWARKEAYLKAIGLGLYRGLSGVTVPVSPYQLEDTPENARRVLDREGGGVWMVRDVPVMGAYSASICWEGADRLQLEVRKLDLDSYLEK